MLFLYDNIFLVIKMLTKEIIHELNNSFTICKGYLKMDKSKYQNFLISEIDNCINLVNKSNAEQKFFLVDSLIKELINYYQTNYNVVITYHKCYASIFGNYHKIKDMFVNIIKNAIEANANKIEIKTNIKNDFLTISLKDNGFGIKKDILSKLKNINLTTKKNGHGVGLKSIKETIKNHNGKFEIKSIYHYGTTIIVSFPI